MAISSQGTTFSFSGLTAIYTSISVEDPQVEIADVTTFTDPIGTRRYVTTGDITQPARVRVDYIRTNETFQPLAFSGRSGLLTIAHPSVVVIQKAILESASSEIAVGQMLRGTLNFVLDNTP